MHLRVPHLAALQACWWHRASWGAGSGAVRIFPWANMVYPRLSAARLCPFASMVSVQLCLEPAAHTQAWAGAGHSGPGPGLLLDCFPQVPLKVSLSTGRSWGCLAPLQ